MANEGDASRNSRQKFMNTKDVYSEEDYKMIGKMLVNLDITRDLLGHSTIYSTLNYCHGEFEKLWHYKFVVECIKRERSRG